MCVLAGCLVFGTVLLRAFTQGQTDYLAICLRAIGAGGITLLGTALLTGFIQKLGGPDQTEELPEQIEAE